MNTRVTPYQLCQELRPTGGQMGARFRFSFTTDDVPGPLRAASLHRINERVLRFFVPNPNLQNDVSIALEEAVSNIFEHSYASSGPPHIQFDFCLQAGQLIVTIEDHGHQGHRLDTQWQQPPPPTEVLKARAIATGGGLGLVLIQKVMDQVHYQIGPNQRNQLILTKRVEE